jgi:hypothetical protein
MGLAKLLQYIRHMHKALQRLQIKPNPLAYNGCHEHERQQLNALYMQQQQQWQKQLTTFFVQPWHALKAPCPPLP